MMTPFNRLVLSSPTRLAMPIAVYPGLHITGGTGQCEIWTDDQDGRGDLGETCATAYQVRRNNVAIGARLAEQLDIVTGLAEHCERMACIPTQDRIAPVHAAARVLTASALVATALAKVTSAESRQRRIIEHVQPVATQKPYSNAKLDACF